LKQLNINLRVVEELYERFKLEVLNFLNNHSETLTEFRIGLYRDGFVSSQETSPQHQPILLNLAPLVPIPDRQFPKLRRIEYCHGIGTSELEHWMTWILRAANLKEISLNFKYPEDVLKSIILKNETTLRIIQIGLHPEWKIMSFDCSIVHNCVNLLLFKIWCDDLNFTFGTENAPEEEGEVLNVDLLPKSLLILRINRMQVSTESCETICRDFPNLIQLSIVFDGVKGSGLPAKIVHEMIREKRITKFEVRVDSGTEDYCANNVAIEGDWPNDPEDTRHLVFAAVNEAGTYVVNKISL